MSLLLLVYIKIAKPVINIFLAKDEIVCLLF
jgi:hypothetical protein